MKSAGARAGRRRRLALVAGAMIAGAVTVAMPWAGSNPVSAASLTVNDTADRVDSQVGNGESRTSAGTCTLRAAIQEANADPTPVRHPFDMTNLVPPNAVIPEAPVNGTSDHSATFTFSAVDDITPPQFMEYECRLDTRDPDAWLECFNPMVFSNLETGTHTFEVRATDSQENIDPTPARHPWTIAPPTNCDEANISLTAAADGWVDEVNPGENKAVETELTVASDELPGNAASPCSSSTCPPPSRAARWSRRRCACTTRPAPRVGYSKRCRSPRPGTSRR